jgi:hypothetical protein
MITINPFWSCSLDSMPSPNLAHTHFTIYISSPSFSVAAFSKIKPVWLSDVRFIPYDKRSLVPVAINIITPISLWCAILAIFAFWHPHFIWCAVSIPMTKGHTVQFQPSHPIFFLLRIIPISQKGPHPKRWKFVLSRAKSFALSSSSPHVQDLDSRQLLFARLRKIGIPLPSAATWRMHLKLWLNGCPFKPKFAPLALLA